MEKVRQVIIGDQVYLEIVSDDDDEATGLEQSEGYPGSLIVDLVPDIYER